jgi:hypothetical protein
VRLYRREALRPAPQPYAWFRRAPARAGCCRRVSDRGKESAVRKYFVKANPLRPGQPEKHPYLDIFAQD